MKKPNSYDEVQAEYTPIELGGHFAVIKKLEETTSKNGKPMIKVAIDFDKNDKQPNYFMDSFKADTRQDKKWPYLGTQYIMSEDQNGQCSRSFKAFITSVEKSNNAECEWGNNFAKWFTGKKVGVVYGENEEEYNGEFKTRHRIRFFCEYSKADSMPIPDKRFANNNNAPKTNNTDFVNVPDGSDEEIPF